MHLKCIEQWIRYSHRKTCEICHQTYDHPELTTYERVVHFKLRNACVVSFLVGMVHGVFIWLDAHMEIQFFWIYVFTCAVFNGIQMGIIPLFDLLRERYWPVHICFFLGFIMGNAPGQLAVFKMSIQVVQCYMINVFFLAIFSVFEKHRYITRQNESGVQ